MRAADRSNRCVVFFCAASTRFGAGHLVRCGALAETLRGAGWRTLLVTGPETRDFLGMTGDAFDQVRLATADAEGIALAVEIAGSTARSAAVVDDYGLPADFENMLARHMPVVAFDDLPRRVHAARLLVDPTPGRRAEDYAPFVPANCSVLTGPRHAILRPPFHTALSARGANDPRRSAGLQVSFGASDPLGLIPKAVSALRAVLPERPVTVVCSRDVAGTLELPLDPRVRVLTDVEGASLARLMDQSALAVGAAGSASWERCVCALPSVVTSIADNQDDIARSLKAVGAATVLPLERFATGLAEACVRLLESGAAYSTMSAAAVKLCDGQGALRIAAAIERLADPIAAPRITAVEA
ncbi:MAG: UDP-2,4-diacetamido-2,4,6-trideoxy-beta-L-altropyranose hydrolase [Alphaproteobacteria bacterium]|nr:UDP-2,4-diacetamido-2,4,6-trideoxy-beta-L-altropyranose hydrolase [Alphaproteobacteria bacterium]